MRYVGDGSLHIRRHPVPLPGLCDALTAVEAAAVCGTHVRIRHVPSAFRYDTEVRGRGFCGRVAEGAAELIERGVAIDLTTGGASG
jgi:threonine dehydrogenase-like Zn-dependent dehydrogenase